MLKQYSIFDLFDQLKTEPDIGEYTHECGQVICHIMRRGYIGKKVLVDVSTQSLRNLFRCGILEDYIPYEGRMRSIVNVGDRQRLLITHYPGVEIHECLPWGSYEQRKKAVGKGGQHDKAGTYGV